MGPWDGQERYGISHHHNSAQILSFGREFPLELSIWLFRAEFSVNAAMGRETERPDSGR